jgi:hypothetical protein
MRGHAYRTGASGHSADPSARRLRGDAHARAGSITHSAPRAARVAAQRAAWAVLGFLALQLVIAVSMVESGFPLWLGTAHNAGAALLLLATIALYSP